MQCRSPLEAFQYTTTDGKKSVVFSVSACEGRPYLPIKLPCGQCISCRIKKSREWALRCMHEGSQHESNSFITITYRESPTSLIKQDFTRFMKRLRKEVDRDNSTKIRYYAVGEYGALLKRPHFHSIIFGYDFPDKFLHSRRRGITLYRSPLLERVWPYGFSTVGSLSFDSAAYVARYCQKKVNGSLKDEHYDGLLPEYNVMSRRPGIGAEWIRRYMDETFESDNCIGPGGIVMRTPRYYDRLYDLDHHEQLEILKEKRRRRARENMVLDEDLIMRQQSSEDQRYSLKRRNMEESDDLDIVF